MTHIEVVGSYIEGCVVGNCKYVKFVGACHMVDTALSGVMPELL